MRCMGFGDKWIKWIKACLCSASISALVNGSPTNEFNPSRGIIKTIEALRHSFFLGGFGSGKKLYLIKWNQAILPYDCGGLNIGSLIAKNLVLLGKWAWRFKTETYALWVKVITSLYGREGGISLSNRRHNSCNSTWNIIVRTTVEIDGLGVNFSNYFARSVGNGDSIQFRNDIWCGDIRLKDKFKRLYLLAEAKDITVKEIFNNSDGDRFK
ncbi:uncharacterized protein [Rutidosis leptorrhynchoides]|uniref:uncharacterized protein n=1 Tax=Rutidosis leptorrhynchoides TaxID=125765 RepID=UPI003A9903FA